MGNPNPKNQFRKGKSGNPNAINVTPGPGAPKRIEDGRYWTRRNLTVPKEDLSPVPFCASDRLTRRAIKQAETLEGLDSIRALEILHRDAYGTHAVTEERVQVVRIASTIDHAADDGDCGGAKGVAACDVVETPGDEDAAT